MFTGSSPAHHRSAAMTRTQNPRENTQEASKIKEQQDAFISHEKISFHSNS
jgi:hypothetical protein